MYLYRIEHRESKIGPYRASVKTKNGMRDFYKIMHRNLGHQFADDYHAHPCYDLVLCKHCENQDNVYGFPTLKKLRAWFGTDEKTYKLFQKHDIVLNRYRTNVRIDAKDKKQSVTPRKYLKEYKEIPYKKVIPSIKD
jgi:hypothetical protein